MRIISRSVVAASVTAFVVGLCASSGSATTNDYTYYAPVMGMGTYKLGSQLYSFNNQAYITEGSVGRSNDKAVTRTNVSPKPPNTSFIGAEARLFYENGQMCLTGGMVYDYMVYSGVGTSSMTAVTRRPSGCPAGYYYSYGKAARINSPTGGWAYWYTYESPSLAMYN